MPEAKIKLKGALVIPILVILAAIVGLRIAAIMKGEIDPTLKKALEDRIYSTEVSTVVHKAQQMGKAGTANQGKMASMMITAAKAKPVIKSLRTTKSIFEFSTTRRDVIVEVEYTLGANELIEYYRFEHAPGWTSWRCIGKSSKASFYMHLF